MKQSMYHTMNLMVSHVLMTYGFKLITFTHILRADGKESKEFWFESNSPDCEFTAEQAAKYLTTDAEELRAINPEHPLLWLRADNENRNTLISIVKKSPRMVEIKNGTRSALIAENASEETKRQIAEML